MPITVPNLRIHFAGGSNVKPAPGQHIAAVQLRLIADQIEAGEFGALETGVLAMRPSRNAACTLLAQVGNDQAINPILSHWSAIETIVALTTPKLKVAVDPVIDFADAEGAA